MILRGLQLARSGWRGFKGVPRAACPKTSEGEAQELIRLGMRFKANVPADGDRHQGHLQIARAPGDGTIIFVLLGRVFMLNDCGFWPMSSIVILASILNAGRSARIDGIDSMALRAKPRGGRNAGPRDRD